MASIGRVAVAAAAGNQETTFTLANFNLDFSLIKMDAPVEYHPLGTSISSKRKLDAEDGKTHATARRLGALFADDLPPIPTLFRAYGLRVSQIAESPKLNPRGTDRDGPLADYVGADGTSIWAAATSGRGAMAAHLLACLLARVWSPSQATSIWSELVSERRAVLERRMQEQTCHVNVLAASRIEIARDKLAEWDASARSWLRTADTAMRLKQTQLTLIVDNMKLDVPAKPTVYDDVMNVWIKGMTLLDNLTSGMAQRVPSGEALMGLCSWHLYPDMCVIGRTHGCISTPVRQDDNLVPESGLLTIGLHDGRSINPVGIAWSMPLAHLRYYGKPVESRTTLQSSTSRISFRNVVQIAIGSVASFWGFGDSRTDKIAIVLIALNIAYHDTGGTSKAGKAWPMVLAQEAKAYAESNERERSEIDRFVSLGRRRFNFLAERDNHPLPCFGLNEPAFYFHYMSPEQRVQALRSIAKTLIPPADLENAIIRSIHPDLQITEYASVVPHWIPGYEHKLYRRWILLPEITKTVDRRVPYTYEIGADLFGTDEIANVIYEIEKQHEAKQCKRLFCFEKDAALHRSMEVIAQFNEPCGFLEHSAILEHPSSFGFSWTMGKSGRSPLTLGELRESADNSGRRWNTVRTMEGWWIGQLEHSYSGMDYTFLFGDNISSAIYRPQQTSAPTVSSQTSISTSQLSADLVATQLSSHCFDSNWLRQYFKALSLPGSRYANYFTSLEALAGAAEVYESLPNAEIDPIFQRGLHSYAWAGAIRQCLNREIALSCVISFETGNLDVEPAELRDVLAISSGNSIYAIETLFRDPCHPYPFYKLRHFIGNVGKPGLGLLISSQILESPEPDEETWQLINEKAFDGQLENNFASTTLHLWLTGYEQALNTRHHGGRDREHYFLETVTSAYDRGTKVADLDLLKVAKDIELAGPANRSVALQHPLLHFPPDRCEHSERERQDSSIFGELISIDNWYELLEPARTSAIIRARGNWSARLAVAAACIERKTDLVIFSHQVCWACAKETLEVEEGDDEEHYLFLC